MKIEVELEKLKEERRQLNIGIHDITNERSELLREQRPLRIRLDKVNKKIKQLKESK